MVRDKPTYSAYLMGNPGTYSQAFEQANWISPLPGRTKLWKAIRQPTTAVIPAQAGAKNLAETQIGPLLTPSGYLHRSRGTAAERTK